VVVVVDTAPEVDPVDVVGAVPETGNVVRLVESPLDAVRGPLAAEASAAVAADPSPTSVARPPGVTGAGAVVVEVVEVRPDGTVVPAAVSRTPRCAATSPWPRRAAVVTDATSAMSASATASTAHQRGRSVLRARSSPTEVARPFSST
jgi:hypothetical protein